MIAQENLNQIHRFIKTPVREVYQYRLDSGGLREHLQESVCVVVGFKMLRYLLANSKDYRRNKRLTDYLDFYCGSYFQTPVYTAYTVSPNDFLSICEDRVDRIIFNRFSGE